MMEDGTYETDVTEKTDQDGICRISGQREKGKQKINGNHHLEQSEL